MMIQIHRRGQSDAGNPTRAIIEAISSTGTDCSESVLLAPTIEYPEWLTAHAAFVSRFLCDAV